MEIRSDIFAKCNDMDALNKEWRKVVFELHPDKGGCAVEFQRAKELLEQRKREIAEATLRAKKRADVMKYVGLAGAVMQDIAEGRDWTEGVKKIVPDDYKLGVDILSALLKK